MSITIQLDREEAVMVAVALLAMGPSTEMTEEERAKFTDLRRRVLNTAVIAGVVQCP